MLRPMEVRKLGRTGLQTPVIGLGTYRVFNVRDDLGEARAETVTTAALDSGARLFDSSPMYGESERVLALSLAGRRQDAIVATKVWARTRAVGEQQIERALQWFERVELYQVHNLLLFDDHLPYLQHLKEAGRITAIGATHYLESELPSLLALMEQGAIDCVQVPYNPVQRAVEQELLPAAAELGVGVIAMMPFRTGQLVERTPTDAQLAPLEELGIRTWAQALLKWILSDPRVHAVIPATSSPTRMAENAAAGRAPWLDDDQRRYIQSLAEALT